MTSPLGALRLALLLSLVACDRPGKSESTPFTKPDPVTPSATASCDGAEPIVDASGLYTGFQRCADGSVDRVEAGAVDPDWAYTACAGTEDSRSCEVDADCDGETALARCVSTELVPSGTACRCEYSCAVDADCPSGELCVATAVGDVKEDHATCVPAACDEGADCTSGECGFGSSGTECDIQPTIACRTAEDSCRTGDTCGEGETCNLTDVDSDHWSCNSSECQDTGGRPLLVAGAPRCAPPTARVDWAASLVVLESAARDALARHWTRVGALEHASVASFARFALQLLSLGAPPELLAQTHRAALDEVAHARLAYGLASAYAGQPVGPGPLALGDLPLLLEPQAILLALVMEGCVGETLAAAEARAAAGAAVDLTVRAVLEQIADEEGQHAALAWRTLQWMLGERPALAEVATQAIARAAALPATSAADGPDLREHGVLSAAERRGLRRATFTEVIGPCLSAVTRGVSAGACA